MQDIKFVEVMEVLEVEKWATEGVLVIATLYSVKENRDQQYEVDKNLIDKKAAGLVVELGRFVDIKRTETVEPYEEAFHSRKLWVKLNCCRIGK